MSNTKLKLINVGVCSPCKYYELLQKVHLLFLDTFNELSFWAYIYGKHKIYSFIKNKEYKQACTISSNKCSPLIPSEYLLKLRLSSYDIFT